MNIDAVMSEVAALLKTLPAKPRVFDHPVDAVSPPTLIVALPEITYDMTYGRGSDRLALPVILAIGKVIDRAARANLAPYIAGSGPNSIKQVLESDDEYESFDALRVQTCTFDVVSFGAVEYLTATFLLDITGDGA